MTEARKRAAIAASYLELAAAGPDPDLPRPGFRIGQLAHPQHFCGRSLSFVVGGPHWIVTSLSVEHYLQRVDGSKH